MKTREMPVMPPSVMDSSICDSKAFKRPSSVSSASASAASASTGLSSRMILHRMTKFSALSSDQMTNKSSPKLSVMRPATWLMVSCLSSILARSSCSRSSQGDCRCKFSSTFSSGIAKYASTVSISASMTVDLGSGS